MHLGLSTPSVFEMDDLATIYIVVKQQGAWTRFCTHKRTNGVNNIYIYMYFFLSKFLLSTTSVNFTKIKNEKTSRRKKREKAMYI